MSGTTVLRERLALQFAQAALFWLLVAALMGVWLRWQAWGSPPVGFPYRFLTHAHSHVMFLGWAFNGLIAVLVWYFLPERVPVLYSRLWLWLQVGVLGMALSFPLQGYKAVSITFSTLHMVLAGWLAVRLWRDAAQAGPATYAFRWAVVFLFLSAIGPFALAYTIVHQLQDTHWYQLAVYYYLHFQYNGWMVLALFAVFLRLFPLSGNWVVRALHLFAIGVLLGFAVSTLWTSPPWPVFLLAALGGLLQLSLVPVLIGWFTQGNGNNTAGLLWRNRLLLVAGASICTKLCLQLLVIWPAVGTAVFINRNWLIAYFHLVFIGVVTCSLLAVFLTRGWVPEHRQMAPAWWGLVPAFVLSELLLVLPGVHIAGLFAGALAMFASVLWIGWQVFRHHRSAA
ncbi:MAG: hypothetical protein EP344_14245 [Bacteroidetes bacterium]|nr:MAG: hypothetical protein EP344_14245 [Bacteroidota bacterium]